MNRRIGCLLLVLAQVGCFTPVTRRIDNTNNQMAIMRSQLAEANTNLAETQATMRRMERHLENTSKSLENASKQLEEANKLLKPLGRLTKPFGGIDADGKPVLQPQGAGVGPGPITEEMCWQGKVKKG